MSVTTPYRTLIPRLADLPDYVGRELGLSPWVTLGQADIDAFATLTHDHQWIHTDPARAARQSPYGSTIAHGFLVLSLAAKFGAETLEIRDAGMGVNYGFDRLRFTAAVPAGGRVRGRTSLLAVEARPPGYKYTLQLTIELEGHDRPACVGEWLVVAYPAETG